MVLAFLETHCQTLLYKLLQKRFGNFAKYLHLYLSLHERALVLEQGTSKGGVCYWLVVAEQLVFLCKTRLASLQGKVLHIFFEKS